MYYLLNENYFSVHCNIYCTALYYIFSEIQDLQLCPKECQFLILLFIMNKPGLCALKYQQYVHTNMPKSYLNLEYAVMCP